MIGRDLEGFVGGEFAGGVVGFDLRGQGLELIDDGIEVGGVGPVAGVGVFAHELEVTLWDG